MILIISTENDNSTTQVIEWLEYLNKSWIRINDNDLVNIAFLGDDIEFEIYKSKFLLSSINSVWYRRGSINFTFEAFSDILSFKILQNAEIQNIVEYIYYRLEQKKNINSFLKSSVNKLIISSIAKEVGLQTPIDLLFSKKSSLLEKTKKANYITKAISGDSIQRIEDYTIFNYTSSLITNKIKQDFFFPSLVQNYIEKKYELRVFYLHNKFYSMAIFSQKDNQTSIDFRQYNKINPNRMVTFNLPPQVEALLDKLMKKIGLNCGSIDIIVTPKDEYVFLEVNPVGQFGMVSYPCNYNIERLIADYL